MEGVVGNSEVATKDFPRLYTFFIQLASEDIGNDSSACNPQTHLRASIMRLIQLAKYDMAEREGRREKKAGDSLHAGSKRTIAQLGSF
jgi:hypothetical protein